jgi:hypothetical protein
LVNFIDLRRLVPAMSQHEIAKAFDDRVRQLEDRDGVHVIVETFGPLSGRSLAHVVVQTAERIATADRQIHPGELQAVELIGLIMLNLPAKRPAITSRSL